MIAASLVAVFATLLPTVANAEPPTAVEEDGTYAVGVDIAPGIYGTAGPVEGEVCYWKRLGSLHGNDILDNAMTKQPQVVEVAATDKAFMTSGCQPWLQTDALPYDAQLPEALAAMIARAKLQEYLNTLNAGAGALGAGQLPVG